MMRLFQRLSVLPGLLALVLWGSSALGQVTVGVSYSVHNDLSPPLTQIEPIPAPSPPVDIPPPVPGPVDERLYGQVPSPPNELRSESETPAEPSSLVTIIGGPLVGFEGLNQANAFGNPPDPNGDVGAGYYVQTTNRSFAIWDTMGNLLYGPETNATLFAGFSSACAGDNRGDPIVLFDHLANRWLFGHIGQDVPEYYQCIAVSETSDPRGSWYRYAFEWPDYFNDYPKFGVWPDGYYMSARFTSMNISVFERDAMLQGQPARGIWSTPPGDDFLVSDLDGPVPPAGTPNYSVRLNTTLDRLEPWAFHVDWANTSNSTFTPLPTLSTASFDRTLCGSGSFEYCIDQPDTPQKLSAFTDWVMYRLQYRNFGTYQTLLTTHTVDADGAGRAGIRWYELRNSGSGWAIHDQGTFSPDTDHRWMGSAALNTDGTLIVGYAVSNGTTTYPSIRYTGRAPGAPPGLLNAAEQTLRDGSGPITHNEGFPRFGDYSMMTVDPDDDRTFWFTNEYGRTQDGYWYSYIGALNATPVSVTLTGETLSDARYYEARTSLEASSTTIADGAEVSFRVVEGGMVLLEAGFVAEAGSDFRASAEGTAGGAGALATVPGEPAAAASAVAATATEPTQFALEPAAPNPFREATMIRFSLPEAAAVRLTVYDLLGREVARLVDGPMPAGTHHVRLDGAALPAGAYLVRLLAGEEAGLVRVTRLR